MIICNRTAECPSPDVHQHDCLKGRTIWADDHFTDSPESAASHAGQNQPRHDHYDPAENRPDWSEL